ncbi:hypothetical protein BN1048_00646 [Jeotgalicoccus saudimassiliensis]|uniref:Uncharacterized protein n=1 Tax=Jeotgalicoccus saudimassiliensis TaxID=1461582 RepID=A0A078M529_9STAP|nr:hypothetical protein BN1048_00646 [Jeotgalicoccus saudimassiliensis]
MVDNGELPLSTGAARFTTGNHRCHSGVVGSQREIAVVIRGRSVHNGESPLSSGAARFTTGNRRCHPGVIGSQREITVVIREWSVHNGKSPLSSGDARFTTGNRRCHPGFPLRPADPAHPPNQQKNSSPSHDGLLFFKFIMFDQH